MIPQIISHVKLVGSVQYTKLTPLQETEARRLAEQQARANKVPKTYSDEEKAARKERVAKAKDAMSRSVGLKGAHVAPARAAIDAATEILTRELFKLEP